MYSSAFGKFPAKGPVRFNGPAPKELLTERRSPGSRLLGFDTNGGRNQWPKVVVINGRGLPAPCVPPPSKAARSIGRGRGLPPGLAPELLAARSGCLDRVALQSFGSWHAASQSTAPPSPASRHLLLPAGLSAGQITKICSKSPIKKPDKHAGMEAARQPASQIARKEADPSTLQPASS